MFQTIIKVFERMKFSYFMGLMVMISTLGLLFIMVDRVQEESYELAEFQISPKTVRATKTVEDTYRTELEKERVAAEVTPSYQYSEEIASNRQALTNSFFTYFIDAKRENEKAEEPLSNQALAKEIKGKISKLEEEQGFKLEEREVYALTQLSVDELQKLSSELQLAVGEALKEPIEKEQVEAVKSKLVQVIERDATLSTSVKNALITFARTLIVENRTVNEELTQARIEKEKEAVEPVRILQGQVIVREGQVIDSEVYRQLEVTGLIKDQQSIRPAIGLFIYLLIIAGFLYMHFTFSKESDVVKKKYVLMTYVVFFLLVGGMRLLGMIDQEFDVQLSFLIPTALAPMIMRLLTNERLAVMMTVITAGTAGILLQEGYAAILQMETTLYVLFGGLVSIYLLGSDGRRSNILKTSGMVALTNIGFIAFYLLMTQSSYSWKELLFYFSAAVVSGLLSGAMTIGILPFLESVFSILSDMKLVELSNPNHPLLKKILMETPGTYHHSVMVANLADAACESVGANGLLARVGSYYHDIGKTVRPNYFIENQHSGVNPHDSLTPEESKSIIIAHATDGARILREYKMPKEIVDIAEQHHGTSFLQFFYHKAKEQNPDVTEDEFRYPGPKPQTKEIAIIMIADSAEAAVRSMKEPTPEKIAKLVHSIIQGKLNDGQFDACSISVRELKKVEAVICETLNGMFHNRIEYPS